MKKIIVSDLIGTLIINFPFALKGQEKFNTMKSSETFDDLVEFLNSYLGGNNYFALVSACNHGGGIENLNQLRDFFDLFLNRIDLEKKQNLLCYISNYSEEKGYQLDKIEQIEDRSYMITNRNNILYYELSGKGFSKETALIDILKRLNYNPNEDLLLGSGDSSKDLDMLFEISKRNGKGYFVDEKYDSWYPNHIDYNDLTNEQLLSRLRVRKYHEKYSSSQLETNIKDEEIETYILNIREGFLSSKISREDIIQLFIYGDIAEKYYIEHLFDSKPDDIIPIEYVKKLEFISSRKKLYQKLTEHNN